MSAVTMHHFSGLAAPFVRSKVTVSGGVFTANLRRKSGAAQKGRFGIASMNAAEDCGDIQTLPAGQKSLAILKRIARLFCFWDIFIVEKQLLRLIDPCFDPYQLSGIAGNLFDMSLHAICAVPLHLVGDMAVHIQGKGRRIMPQVFLHSLNVIAGLNSQNSVRMS